MADPVKVSARLLKLAINTGTGNTFTEIKGMTSWAPDRSQNSTDTTTLDESAQSHILTPAGLVITGDGFLLVDPATGARDPGQEAVEAAALAGPGDPMPTWRLTKPGGATETFRGSVKATVGGQGGGVSDAAKWNVEVTRSGDSTYTPAPATV